MAEKQTGSEGNIPEVNPNENLNEELLKLLQENTENPSEAFLLVQQMSVYLWAQYKIDWEDQPDHKVAANRKQRYLDFVSALVDSLAINDAAA